MILEEQYILDKVTIDDYESFYKVYLQLENTVPFSKNKFQQVIKHNETNGNIYLCIRLKKNNLIVGCAKLVLEIKFGNNKGYIEDLVIDQDHRSKKLGSYLIYKLLECAKKNNCYLCTLTCTEDFKSFYQKIGFTGNKLNMRYML